MRTLLQPGNDKIAFYSTVPGYYPSTGSQSPVSLVAYRVNQAQQPSYNKLERMGKGLVWNAVDARHRALRSCSCLYLSRRRFLRQSCRIQRLVLPHSGLARRFAAAPSTWSDSEVIGPQVFRFEYYYLLKGGIDPTSGTQLPLDSK